MPASGIDRIVAQTAQVVIGEFRLPADHPSFRDTGPISHCIVVFPRTSVWIRHEGSRAFLADPTVSTIYNRGQRYERVPHSALGDHCDWFGVSDNVAREIAATLEPRAADSPAPFQFQRAPSDTRLYFRQRRLLARARRGELDDLEQEEEVMAVVGDVLRSAHTAAIGSGARRPGAAARHRQLAESARAELLRTVTQNLSVHDIAARVHTSPYHLCRVFRSVTGRTMHEYRAELRVRLSLEMLADSAASLSTVAHELGFASHSHFVTALRRHLGDTPSAVRAALR